MTFDSRARSRLPGAERAWARSGCRAVCGTLVAPLPLSTLGGTPGKKFVRGALFSPPANIFPGGCPAASVSFCRTTLSRARLGRGLLAKTMLKESGHPTEGRLARTVLNVAPLLPAWAASGGGAVRIGRRLPCCLLAQRSRRETGSMADARRGELAPFGGAAGQTESRAELVARVDAAPGEVPGRHSGTPVQQARRSMPGLLLGVAAGQTESRAELVARVDAAPGEVPGRHSGTPVQQARRSIPGPLLAGLLVLSAALSACAPVVRCVPGSQFLPCEVSK